LIEPAARFTTLRPALKGLLTHVKLRCPCDDAGDSPVRAQGLPSEVVQPKPSLAIPM